MQFPSYRGLIAPNESQVRSLWEMSLSMHFLSNKKQTAYVPVISCLKEKLESLTILVKTFFFQNVQKDQKKRADAACNFALFFSL